MGTKCDRNLNPTDERYDPVNLDVEAIEDYHLSADIWAWIKSSNEPGASLDGAWEDSGKHDSDSFTKHDTGKRQLSLLPFEALEKITDVLMFGAEKYDRDNWKKCTDTDRYMDALFRHLAEIQKGEVIDAETGLSHLSHAGCNILFLLYFEVLKEAVGDGD